MKNRYLLLFFGVLSGLLVYLFTSRVASGQFLYMGDQALRMNLFESSINAFYLKRLVNLGTPNAWEFATQFFDYLFYIFIYSVGVTKVIIVERVNFFIVIFLTLSLSFTGFKNLSKLYKIDTTKFHIFLVSFWFAFNPYTLSLWHGGVFNITAGLTYALAPLSLYYFHMWFFGESTNKTAATSALLIFLQSFVFWLFAPFAVFLGIYGICILIINKPPLRVFFSRVLLFVAIYLPLAAVVLYPILYEYFNAQGVSNADFSPPFGNQLGGLQYQFLMIFSWGIYNIWTPRAMYSFHAHFFTRTYINSTLLLYGMIGFSTFLIFSKSVANQYRKKVQMTRFYFFVFILIFCVSLFFSKGAQKPLGEIFLYLYENMPLFSVFRTPDIRFGFSIVLCVSILLLLASTIYRKVIFAVLMGIVLLFQVTPLWTGEAFYGKNIDALFYDRIVAVPKEYRELAAFFNQNTTISYILPLPSFENGHYQLPPKDKYIGQDILSKEIKLPFIYLSQSTGIHAATYKALTEIIQNSRIELFKNFPIQYVLMRNDVICEKCRFITNADMSRRYPKVFSNSLFSVYEIGGLPLVSGEKTTFTMVNPLHYKITMRDVKNSRKLAFLLSYNKDWKLYEGSAKTELEYLWKSPIFDSTHAQHLGYANQWIVAPSKKLSDIYLTLYYQPQSQYWLSLIITLLSTASICTVLLKAHRNKGQSNKTEAKRRKVDTSTDLKPSHNHILTFEMMKSYVAKKTVLDVGCWTGQYEELAKDIAKKIVAIDPGAGAIETAQKRFKRYKNLAFKYGVAEKLQFGSNSFDTVIYSEVIEHIPQNYEQKSVQEIYRVLKKGGTLILTTPNNNLLSIVLDPAYFLIGHRHYSPDYLVSLLTSQGFRIKDVQTVGGFYNLAAVLAESVWKHLRFGALSHPEWLAERIKKEWKNGYMRVYIVATK